MRCGGAVFLGVARGTGEEGDSFRMFLVGGPGNAARAAADL